MINYAVSPCQPLQDKITMQKICESKYPTSTYTGYTKCTDAEGIKPICTVATTPVDPNIVVTKHVISQCQPLQEKSIMNTICQSAYPKSQFYGYIKCTDGVQPVCSITTTNLPAPEPTPMPAPELAPMPAEDPLVQSCIFGKPDTYGKIYDTTESKCDDIMKSKCDGIINRTITSMDDFMAIDRVRCLDWIQSKQLTIQPDLPDLPDSPVLPDLPPVMPDSPDLPDLPITPPITPPTTQPAPQPTTFSWSIIFIVLFILAISIAIVIYFYINKKPKV